MCDGLLWHNAATTWPPEKPIKIPCDSYQGLYRGGKRVHADVVVLSYRVWMLMHAMQKGGGEVFGTLLSSSERGFFFVVGADTLLSFVCVAKLFELAKNNKDSLRIFICALSCNNDKANKQSEAVANNSTDSISKILKYSIHNNVVYDWQDCKKIIFCIQDFCNILSDFL